MTIRGHCLGGQTIEDGDAYRLLVAEVFNQAIRDAHRPSFQAKRALAWLNCPDVRELALLLDVELPANLTQEHLRRYPRPKRDHGQGEVDRECA